MNHPTFVKFENITDVFFDLDHTLWDFERNSALAFERIFSEHAFEFSLDLFLNWYSPINLKYWKLFREGKINQVDLRYQRLKEVFDQMQVHVDDAVIHLLSEKYIEYLPQFPNLHEGATEILDYLTEKGYVLHIITNGFHEVQKQKMLSSGIYSYFSTVTDADVASAKKPDPKIFEKAFELSKAPVSQSVMIGDSWEVDVEAAQAFGMHAIYFNEMQAEIPENAPAPVINQLLDIKKLL